ncbi:hypothetical protein DAI22_12g127300 [Oryza sativa Japonica Group]|nr:hypothetical protein DAI22_12g127300 [Oryza sativa Japonica Group]KAF2907796.1 hypothetical protein DAI22_12g127300 [Oryza sativa Japonica Group]
MVIQGLARWHRGPVALQATDSWPRSPLSLGPARLPSPRAEPVLLSGVPAAFMGRRRRRRCSWCGPRRRRFSGVRSTPIYPCNMGAVGRHNIVRLYRILVSTENPSALKTNVPESSKRSG